jgi:hypothetical protein
MFSARAASVGAGSDLGHWSETVWVKMLTRRALVGTSSLIGVTAVTKLEAHAFGTAVVVGAIRWDPWYSAEAQGARRSVEKTLSPSKWHNRAPSCATVKDDDSVDFGRCASQREIDEEIAAAASAHIAFWAYVWYGPEHVLQNAWRLHQTSQQANDIRWSIIFAGYTLFIQEVGRSVDQYLGFFAKTNYQRLPDGRPLLFVLPDKAAWPDVKRAIFALRAASIKRGLPAPYVVLLAGTDRLALSQTESDAIGIYSKVTQAPVAAPFGDLVRLTEAYWDKLATMGPMIPTAMTGADRRPRVEHPVPWEEPA